MFIQKTFVIPSYEKLMNEQQEEIDKLNMEKNFLQSQMYKYKNKVVKMTKEKCKEVDNNDKNQS